MKMMWKKFIAMSIAIMVVLTGLPVQQVFAEELSQETDLSVEDKSIAEQEDTIQDIVDSDEKQGDNVRNNEEKQETLLNYIFVDKPYIETPDTQKIVAGIGGAGTSVEYAVLIYKNVDTGEEYRVEAGQLEEDTAVFTVEHRQDEAAAVYQITNITYRVQGKETTVNLNEIGIDVKYGVNGYVNNNADAEIIEEDAGVPDIGTVVTDKDGNILSNNSLQDALEKSSAAVIEHQGVSSKASVQSKSGNIVIVLDPGHGGTDGGTSYTYNGVTYYERNITLKIASYCKAELEKYKGATVYLTRSDNTSRCMSRLERAQYAKEKGANVLVSFHINSTEGGQTTATGAEIFYPNTSYNAQISAEGKALSERILEKLKGLGLVSRGAQYKDSVEDSYEDGSKKDYLGINRYCKELGFPGILIEHAFLNNQNDFTNYLSSDEKLNKLGVADAAGIAEYYNLQKNEIEYGDGAAKVIASKNSNTTQVHLSATGTPSIYKMKYAVWSAANGQDDLIWYDAVQSTDGSWITDVPVKNHKTEGTYYVHAYVQRSNGTMYKVGETSFQIGGPSARDVKITDINKVNGTFRVTVTGITSPSGISKVEIPVWSAADQNDIKWYPAVKQSDGSYMIIADITNHKSNYGNYNIHVYATDGNGIQKCVKTTSLALEKQPTNVKISGNGSQTEYTVEAVNVPYGSGISKVQFAVWSAENGQDDLRWYPASKNSSGAWTYKVPISNHKTAGTYYVHTYVNLKDGKNEKLSENSFAVNGASAADVKVTDVDKVNGIFRVTVTGVTAPNGVNKVQIPVWSTADQNDIKWYPAVRQSDGSYTIIVDITNHKSNYGNYNIHVYVTDGNGIQSCVKTTNLALQKQPTTVKITGNSSQTEYTAEAVNVPYGSGISKVQFAVWSAENGQDDLKWYSASKNSSGTWTYKVPISNHKTAGTYYVHTYVGLKNGRNEKVSENSFMVNGPSASAVKITDVNKVDGTFRVTVTGITSASGINKVEIPVWSAADQNDIKWYPAVKQTDGSYMIIVDITNHKSNYGNYNIHVYATDGSGIQKCVKTTTLALKKQQTTVKAEANSAKTVYSLTASNVPYGSAVDKVQFAVWSAANNQDDLKWYTADKSGTGTWTYNVSVSNHKTEGSYYVHTYVTLKNGRNEFIGEAAFSVAGPKASSTAITKKNEADGTFTVRVTGVTSDAPITQVRIPVWCAKDQSDIVWYTATQISNGTYEAYVDVKNHKNSLGTYISHVYVYDQNGLEKNVGQTTCLMANVTSSLYNIMGSTAITVDQMMAYYQANQNYPAFYADSDAPTLRQFCEIYLQESAAEGVKAEVAFCQAMNETGFLRYGGDVSIEQYNFAGIGATGNGVKGNSFSSVREGVRAQVQHLKGYASKEDLNQACVDPRFVYLKDKRGCAPYVEWLGQKENPSGNGWATATNYGYTLKERYIAKLLNVK